MESASTTASMPLYGTDSRSRHRPRKITTESLRRRRARNWPISADLPCPLAPCTCTVIGVLRVRTCSNAVPSTPSSNLRPTKVGSFARRLPLAELNWPAELTWLLPAPLAPFGPVGPLQLLSDGSPSDAKNSL